MAVVSSALRAPLPLRVQANLFPANICTSRGVKLYGHRNVALRVRKAAITEWVCRNFFLSSATLPAPCIVVTVSKTVLNHTMSACLKHQGRACTILKYTLRQTDVENISVLV